MSFLSFRPPDLRSIWINATWNHKFYISKYVSHNHTNFDNYPSTLGEKDTCRVRKSIAKERFSTNNKLFVFNVILQQKAEPRPLKEGSQMLIFNISDQLLKSKDHDKIWPVDLYKYGNVLVLWQFGWQLELNGAQESKKVQKGHLGPSLICWSHG